MFQCLNVQLYRPTAAIQFKVTVNIMDSKQFWRTVSSATNHRATARVNKIGNAVGEENICAMWFDYFKNLYNSVPSTIDSGVVNDACAELDFL